MFHQEASVDTVKLIKGDFVSSRNKSVDEGSRHGGAMLDVYANSDKRKITKVPFFAKILARVLVYNVKCLKRSITTTQKTVFGNSRVSV